MTEDATTEDATTEELTTPPQEQNALALDSSPDALAKYIPIPIDELIAHAEKGITYADIGRIYGVSRQSISERMRKEGYSPKRLQHFRRNELGVNQLRRAQLLSNLSPEKQKEMSGKDLTIAYGVLYDKEHGKKINIETEISIREARQREDELDAEEAALLSTLEGQGVVIDAEVIEDRDPDRDPEGTHEV